MPLFYSLLLTSILAYGVSVLGQTYSIKDLGALGGSFSQANAINATGQIVGTSGTTGTPGGAFIYSGGKMINLGTLGGSPRAAYGINNPGSVGGYSNISSGDLPAFLWQKGKMKGLGQ